MSTDDIRKAKRRAWYRRYKEKYPDKLREKSRVSRQKWRVKYPDKDKDHQEKSKKRKRETYQTPEGWLKVRAAHLKRSFGMTLDDYQEIHDRQGGRCAICGREESARYRGRVKLLAVDHCHRTNKIRGLLCQSCNVIIGTSGDDPLLLLQAIGYIRHHATV